MVVLGSDKSIAVKMHRACDCFAMIERSVCNDLKKRM